MTAVRVNDEVDLLIGTPSLSVLFHNGVHNSRSRTDHTLLVALVNHNLFLGNGHGNQPVKLGIDVLNNSSATVGILEDAADCLLLHDLEIVAVVNPTVVINLLGVLICWLRVCLVLFLPFSCHFLWHVDNDGLHHTINHISRLLIHYSIGHSTRIIIIRFCGNNLCSSRNSWSVCVIINSSIWLVPSCTNNGRVLNPSQ